MNITELFTFYRIILLQMKCKSQYSL